MTAPNVLNVFGGDLTSRDYDSLAERWITPEVADVAGIRRVDSITGCGMFGRKRGDMAGLIIPNRWPGEDHVREYRLRLDHPELERSIDGSVRDGRKYVGSPQRGNVLYIPPSVPPALLVDTGTPVVVTEGEFKALSLWRASCTGPGPRFLSVSVAGVWCFRGTVGKATGPDGERRDIKGVLPDFERIAWKGRRVVIAYDADAEQNPKVRMARAALTATLVERGALVGNLEWPIGEGKGVDDRLANVGPERVLTDIASVEFGDWRTKLLRNRDGNPKPVLANAVTALRLAPEWAGVAAYNEFAAQITIQKALPWGERAGGTWSDQHDRKLAEWLQRKGILAATKLAGEAVQTVAMEHPYHPCQDYLRSLVWDSTERVDPWLTTYIGAQPSTYVAKIGRRWLVSAVARILQPGIKADAVLVLEGAQGIGKSSAGRILFDPWFCDHLPDLSSKDSYLQLAGMWCIELAELDAIGRADASRIKSFLSSSVDRYRLPYGTRAIDVPRSSVFLGTVNHGAYLRDETGNRRFWPVRCGQIDLDSLRADRDQLWAEAVALFTEGASWWVDSADLALLAQEEQSARYEGEAWDSEIAEWARLRDTVSVAEVLGDCLKKDRAMWTQTDSNRVARSLRSMGWERYRERSGAGLQWRYRRLES